MTDDQFYQSKFFDAMNSRFDKLEESQEVMQKNLDEIKNKVVYMYGAVAAITFCGSMLFEWFKSNIMHG